MTRPTDPFPLPLFGWQSDFPRFRDAGSRAVRGALQRSFPNAAEEQVLAWDESIPLLQGEVRLVCDSDVHSNEHTAILEYELPNESRRVDVVLLVRGAVIVIELKGKTVPTQLDLDQASAYARDLRFYHRVCAEHPVYAVVVPTHAAGRVGVRDGIHIVGPDALHSLIQDLQPEWAPRLAPEEFLSDDAYQPLPTLVAAARMLFESGSISRIHRARARTQPAVDEIGRIIREAERTRTRRLVLVTGVPGAGKTLVGLQVVHARHLDDLAVTRAHGRPTAPAVFLSGNDPLVKVLQYELRGAGGDGKAFVRRVKDYVKKYTARSHLVPPEHVLVFDEAQRAWDKDKVAEEHEQETAKSEPEHFVEFAERIPSWCVVIGLVGTGQEIHVGEEGGLVQWRRAVEGCTMPTNWTVHAPSSALVAFGESTVRTVDNPALNLDTAIRFHCAAGVHEFVENLLAGSKDSDNSTALATQLAMDGYHLRITRSLDVAKQYLRDRYKENNEARFGVIASSRDKDLKIFGVANDFQSTRTMNVGAWFGDNEEGTRSCRRFAQVATEFDVQGLELDAALLAWGTDLVRERRSWTNSNARKYKRGAKVKDALALRVNAYRVLLTRGRDGTIVFVPPLTVLDETFSYLVASGFERLMD